VTPVAERAGVNWWAIGEENVYAHRKRLRFILEAVEAWRTSRGCQPGEVRLLDVGCGTGTMITLPLASLGYQVTGLDVHGPSVDAARRLNPYANAAFRQADPATVAKGEERFDVVVASEVLEHLQDPLACLRVLRGLLAAGGILILTTPNGYGWFELEQWLWDDLGLGAAVLWWHARWRRFVQALKAPIKRAIGWAPRPAPTAPPWDSVESTENVESPHLQRFRRPGLRHLLALAGFRAAREGRGSLVCGKLTNHYLRNCRSFVALNARAAEALPRALAAGWYLVCEIDPARPRLLCLSDSGLVGQAPSVLEASFGAPPSLLVSFRQLRQRPRLAFSLPFRRFDAAAACLSDVHAPLYRDFIVAYLFLVRARRRVVVDPAGGKVEVGTREGLGALGRCLGDVVRGPLEYAAARYRAARPTRRPPARPRRISSRWVAYLRANLWQESKAGGSVAHTAGVLGGFAAAGLGVTYFGAADFPPARRLGARVVVVPPEQIRLRNFPDLPFVAYSRDFTRRCLAVLEDEPPAFFYQRYSLLNDSGAAAARRLGRPLVLEYNGSEVWIARHWSTPLMFEGLAARIEAANLHAADLVVVVSRALRDEVVSRGISVERVLVNPNAVDPAVYHPGIDDGPVRRRLGLDGKLVIGFVGTFGPWHGAEVLARAVKEVAQRLPTAHFLFVGDGSGMPKVRGILAEDGVLERVTLTGLVPQAEAPTYLAACDILASPHVPNPDGSPFFGSPTKLFEYMAMGKGIVASDLDQIGEILTHEKTAWLVRPGDVDALSEGILRLAEGAALRERLGAAARAEAIRHHTWTAHVARLLLRMRELDLLSEDGVAHDESKT